MADYQKMYHQLFNDVTDAISLLQEAQRRTEETYISADDTPLSILEVSKVSVAEEKKEPVQDKRAEDSQGQ